MVGVSEALRDLSSAREIIVFQDKIKISSQCINPVHVLEWRLLELIFARNEIQYNTNLLENLVKVSWRIAQEIKSLAAMKPMYLNYRR